MKKIKQLEKILIDYAQTEIGVEEAKEQIFKLFKFTKKGDYYFFKKIAIISSYASLFTLIFKSLFYFGCTIITGIIIIILIVK